MMKSVFNIALITRGNPLAFLKSFSLLSCLFLAGPAFAQVSMEVEDELWTDGWEDVDTDLSAIYDEDAFADIIATRLPAESCTAHHVFVSGIYLGCLTNVNGHQHVHPSRDLTVFGCLSYCSNDDPRLIISGPNILMLNGVEDRN